MLPRLKFSAKMVLLATSFTDSRLAIDELRLNLKPLLAVDKSGTTELNTVARDIDRFFALIDHFLKAKNNNALDDLDDFLLAKLAPAENYDLLLLNEPLQGSAQSAKSTLILDPNALHFYNHNENNFHPITNNPDLVSQLWKALAKKGEIPRPVPQTLKFDEQKIIVSLAHFRFVKLKERIIKFLIPDLETKDQPELLKKALHLTQITAEALLKIHTALQGLIKTAGYEKKVDELVSELSAEVKKKNILYEPVPEMANEDPPSLSPKTSPHSSRLATGKNSLPSSLATPENNSTPVEEEKTHESELQEAFQLKTAWELRQKTLQEQAQTLQNTSDQIREELSTLFSENHNNDNDDQHAKIINKSSTIAGQIIQRNEIEKALRVEQIEYNQKIALIHQKITVQQLDFLKDIQAGIEDTKQKLLALSQRLLLGNFYKTSLKKIRSVIDSTKNLIAELTQHLKNLEIKIHSVETALSPLENSRIQVTTDLPSFNALKNQLTAIKDRHLLLTQNKGHLEQAILEKIEKNLQKAEEKKEQEIQKRKTVVNKHIERFITYLKERSSTFKIRDFLSGIAAFFLNCLGYKTEKEKRVHYLEKKLLPQLTQYANSGSNKDKTIVTGTLKKGITAFSPRNLDSQKSLRFFLSNARTELLNENSSHLNKTKRVRLI